VTVVRTHKSSLDTPALLVDLDILEANITRMARVCRANGVAWRPHIKGLKVPALAHKLIGAGAVGVTCATLREAEVMVAAGIRSVLVCNQVVGASKLIRLAGLSRHAEVIVAVDALQHVVALQEAAASSSTIVNIVIEVDTGLHRAGIPPGSRCVELASEIDRRPNLRLKGLATWEGHTTEIGDPGEKQNAVRNALGPFVESAELCRAAGYPIGIVSCGGTGNYWISAAFPGVTEIQAGGGVFGDVRYRTKFNVDLSYALTVISTVTSRPNKFRIVCDAGRKAMSTDAALPAPIGPFQLARMRFSAEHTTIDLDCPDETLQIGDPLEFVVGYSDTTVFLHDQLVGIRDGRVEIVWPIWGRVR
jgi:D-serine deaminase-like pyridoxal phosphate-dependent protein